MKTYIFEQIVSWGNNYNREVNLPDNIRFCEWQRYSDKQIFYFSVVKDPTEEIEKIFKDNFSRSYKIKNILIGILSDVNPLCEIPEMTIDEVNNEVSEDLHEMYIVSNCKNYKYESLQRDLMFLCISDNIEKLKTSLETQEAKELLEKLKNVEPTYIEAIIRPIKFVKNGCDQSPGILCDCVHFKSWVDIDKNIDNFEKTVFDSSNLTEDKYSSFNKNNIYSGEKAYKWRDMFEKRIKEITKTAFEHKIIIYD